MSIFSSKTKIVKDVTSLLLYADTPNLVKDSVIVATMQNRSITDDILDNYLNGLAVKSDNFRRWAEQHYTYGLPNGSMAPLPVKDSIIKQVLETVLTAPVLIDFNVLDTFNADFFAYDFIQANRGWDYLTGIIDAPPFTPTIANDVFFSYADILDDHVTLRIYYEYDNGSGTTTETEDIVISTVYPQDIYYHVGYYLYDANGNITGNRLYWTYNESGQGEATLYPKLDLPGVPEAESPYYPIIPVREHRKDLTNPNEVGFDQNLYDEASRLCRFLGMDYDSLGDGASGRDKENAAWDQVGEPYWINPEVSDVDHVYMIVGVDLQSEVANTQVYLHDYFKHLANTSVSQYSDYVYWEANRKNSAPPPINKVIIEDANFKNEITYNYITDEIIVGTVFAGAKVGDVVRINGVLPRGSINAGAVELYSYETSSITFQKQITTTQYSQITVKGLVHINYLYPNHTVTTTLAESLAEDENGFIIPLHVVVSKSMGIMQHNSLLYDAIRMNFHTLIKQKVKWYQSNWFKIVLQVVAVIVTILSVGQLGPAMAALLGVSQVTGYFVAALILIGISVQAKEIAKNTDSMWAVVFQIAAMYVAGVVANLGSLKDVTPSPESIAPGRDLPVGTPPSFIADTVVLADNLLKITQSLFKIATAYNTDNLIETQEELDAVKEDSEKLRDEIEEFYGDRPDPWEAIRITGILTPTSTPTDFFNRTIHSGNIGVLSLDQSGYVDRKLGLDLPHSDIRLVI